MCSICMFCSSPMCHFSKDSDLQHKCDLINMSYGEPSLLPDYGRFVDLVNEVFFSVLLIGLADFITVPHIFCMLRILCMYR